MQQFRQRGRIVAAVQVDAGAAFHAFHGKACAAQPKDEFANYVPKTQYDNTPYRFNMDKGKKFTAAEFDAWMKSRGVRVVQARPAATGATPAASPQGTVPQTATVSD